MKLINRFLSALALLCAAGCTNAKNQTVELPDNAVLLDVRSVEEFQSGHLPGAVNLPLPEISPVNTQSVNSTVVFAFSCATNPLCTQHPTSMG